MKKKIIITISIVALLVTGTIFAVASQRPFAQRHFGKRGLAGNPEQLIEHALDRAAVMLDLTDAQKTQIKAILEAEKPVVQPLILQLATNRKEMQEITSNGSFNESQVQAIANKQGQLMSKLIVEKERVQSQVYVVLTPEQRAKAEKLRNQFMERFQERFIK